MIIIRNFLQGLPFKGARKRNLSTTLTSFFKAEQTLLQLRRPLFVVYLSINLINWFVRNILHPWWKLELGALNYNLDEFFGSSCDD